MLELKKYKGFRSLSPEAKKSKPIPYHPLKLGRSPSAKVNMLELKKHEGFRSLSSEAKKSKAIVAAPMGCS